MGGKLPAANAEKKRERAETSRAKHKSLITAIFAEGKVKKKGEGARGVKYFNHATIHMIISIRLT